MPPAAPPIGLDVNPEDIPSRVSRLEEKVDVAKSSADRVERDYQKDIERLERTFGPMVGSLATLSGDVNRISQDLGALKKAIDDEKTGALNRRWPMWSTLAATIFGIAMLVLAILNLIQTG